MAIAMQCLHDNCYNFDLNNDVLFNPMKSVYMLFNPNWYKIYRQNIMIGTEVLKYVDNTKYWKLHFVKQ